MQAFYWTVPPRHWQVNCKSCRTGDCASHGIVICMKGVQPQSNTIEKLDQRRLTQLLCHMYKLSLDRGNVIPEAERRTRADGKIKFVTHNFTYTNMKKSQRKLGVGGPHHWGSKKEYQTGFQKRGDQEKAQGSSNLIRLFNTTRPATAIGDSPAYNLILHVIYIGDLKIQIFVYRYRFYLYRWYTEFLANCQGD